ncbi:ComF family protein [Alteriqipengyuania sp.]|uniref:ComF family protein n=1 Tax=Alteriqipengyuania sp. TaxID=2800692 RepID=UPI00351390D7
MPAIPFSSALKPLVDFIYPPRCPLCGEGTAAGPGLCGACWDTLDFPGEPACTQCQTPLETAAMGSICTACHLHRPEHAGIAAAMLYNDPARQLVLRFKHGGRIGLAKLMGRLIAARLVNAPADAVLIAVPLHRVRLWMRGYNQAALLARAISTHTGMAVMVDGLKRTRATPKLGGLGRKQRAKVLRGAIRVNEARAASIRGRHVVLVDDVLTSGATSSACVRALLVAGAKSVRIACFARVADQSTSDIATPKHETPETAKVPGAA